MKTTRLATLLLLTGLVSGCASVQVTTAEPPFSAQTTPRPMESQAVGARIAMSPAYREKRPSSVQNVVHGLDLLAQQLDANTRHKSAFPAVLASTFVNLDRIDDTSPLGRLLTEGLVARLQVRGWNLYDIRLSKAVAITPEGEFVLSRDPKRLEYQYATAAALTGTYTVTASEVLVHARIIDVSTGVVVASGEVRIPIDEEVARLLTDQDQLRPMRIIRGQ
jgi:TolB-like protein